MQSKTKAKTGEEPQDAPASGSSQDKAKLRRAQVRKAQIEHRQRKANYVKQLEIDVARIRDMIEANERDVRVLKAQNTAMRSQLAAGTVPAPPIPPPQRSTAGELPQAMDTSLSDDIQLGNSNDVTLSLELDQVMNLPVYQISSDPPSTSHPAHTRFDPSKPTEIRELPCSPFTRLTPEQTQRIVNFILALEHVCWDHFRPPDFQPDTAEPFGTESGHTLMASSLALRTAPGAVFDVMRAQLQLPPPPQQQPSSVPPAASAAALTLPTATPEIVGAPPPHQPSPAAHVSWPVSGLTLQSLHGLASSINPADLDLTPVQAWFELAARYPIDVLLRRDVEDRLKREFVGVVKCPHYGAAIERGAFESICARVLGPEIVALGSA